MYNGENRPGGAMITLVLNKPKQGESVVDAKKNENAKKGQALEKEAKPEVKFDSVFVQILNDKNELIRTIKFKTPKENGIHRIYWNLDEKGVRGPSRRLATGNSFEPRGVSVLPGTYNIRAHFGNKTVSEKISVSYDPRLEMPMEVLQSKYNLLKQLESKTAVAGKATDKLLQSKQIVEDYKKRINQQESKEKYADVLKMNSDILKQINNLLDDMLGKEDNRQGITATEFPSTISYLFNARRYVNDLLQKPGKTETTLIKNADEKVSAVISKINDFYKNEWVNYRNTLEKLELSPFKPIEELKYE